MNFYFAKQAQKKKIQMREEAVSNTMTQEYHRTACKDHPLEPEIPTKKRSRLHTDSG